LRDRRVSFEERIIVPAATQDNERIVRGTIEAVGPGRQTDTGDYFPVSLAVEDIVVFDKMQAITVKEDGNTYYFLHEIEVIVYDRNPSEEISMRA
jgi:co-chaperonin GroES (HSP10)